MKYVLFAETDRFTDLFIFYRAEMNKLEELALEYRGKAQFEFDLFPEVYSALIKPKRVLAKLLNEDKI